MMDKLHFKLIHWSEIKDANSQVIGGINLVSHCESNNDIYYIEYELAKKWRGKGIMSEKLPEYLNFCKQTGYNRLVALVKKDNVASIKLLEKNKFLKFKEIDDNISYIIHLGIDDWEAISRLPLDNRFN